jgi:hypothetical protein
LNGVIAACSSTVLTPLVSVFAAVAVLTRPPVSVKGSPNLYATRAPVKSGFYVPTEAVARVAKIHSLVMESSYLSVKIFETIGKAARWLRVPKGMLALDPTES